MKVQHRLFHLLLFGLFLVSPTWAQGLSLPQVTEKLENARQAIDDISAQALFNFQLRVGILPYSDSLTGTYLYKKPDRHKLDFPDAPSYLKSVPSMFSWQLPNSEKYNCRVEGPLLENSMNIYRLNYSSNNPDSKTDSIVVSVDSKKWRVFRQDTRYKDGGSVLLQFTYIDWKQSSLLEKVSGDLNIPSYNLKGKAAITLSSHKVNQGLKDSQF